MPKPNLGDMHTVLDPMLSDNFELLIPNIPGGVGDSKLLRIQCRTANKPGKTMETVLIGLFGHEMNFAGRTTFSKTMTIEFVENYKGEIIRTLEQWMSLIRSPGTQHGNFRTVYATTANLIIYDQEGNKSRTYLIHKLWPTELPESPFDGSAATNITVSATFSFDYYELEGENLARA